MSKAKKVPSQKKEAPHRTPSNRGESNHNNTLVMAVAGFPTIVSKRTSDANILFASVVATTTIIVSNTAAILSDSLIRGRATGSTHKMCM
jgi:hypothetical protein